MEIKLDEDMPFLVNGIECYTIKQFSKLTGLCASRISQTINNYKQRKEIDIVRLPNSSTVVIKSDQVDKFIKSTLRGKKNETVRL